MALVNLHDIRCRKLHLVPLERPLPKRVPSNERAQNVNTVLEPVVLVHASHDGPGRHIDLRQLIADLGDQLSLTGEEDALVALGSGQLHQAGCNNALASSGGEDDEDASVALLNGTPDVGDHPVLIWPGLNYGHVYS